MVFHRRKKRIAFEKMARRIEILEENLKSVSEWKELRYGQGGTLQIRKNEIIYLYDREEKRQFATILPGEVILDCKTIYHKEEWRTEMPMTATVRLVLDGQTQGGCKEFSGLQELKEAILKELDPDVEEVLIKKKNKAGYSGGDVGQQDEPEGR